MEAAHRLRTVSALTKIGVIEDCARGQVKYTRAGERADGNVRVCAQKRTPAAVAALNDTRRVFRYPDRRHC